MNRFTIGYAIHNKSHMLMEILSGLKNNISEEVNYIFIFDGCEDDSLKIFEDNKNLIGSNIKIIITDNIFALKTNNLLMKNFETEYLIIFQDDMVLQDKNILNNILLIRNKYGDKLGIIGGRDGFESGYSDMHGSIFSLSNRIPIPHGEFIEKSMVNIGPLVFYKGLIDKVGYFKEVYGIGSYEEMDYSMACKHIHNMTNIVLGTDLIHSTYNHLKNHKFETGSGNLLCKQLPINRNQFNSTWGHVVRL